MRGLPRLVSALAAAFACSAGSGELDDLRAVPASDPRLWYAGRTQISSDGSRSYDWEATSFYANVVRTSFVRARISTSGPSARLQTSLLDFQGETFQQTTVWVSPRTGSDVYLVVDRLDPKLNYTLRLFNTLEPSMSQDTQGGRHFTFHGLEVDGDLGAATPPARRLEFVGDSITAGYGALCGAGGPTANAWTSSNYGTWDRLLCDFFGALCTVVAWSGKGVYQNCCDDGMTMPEYYLQTRAGENRTQSWDFGRFTPDALVVNLGTNDFNHDSGPEWRANFTAAYARFVLDAVQKRYAQPSLPVFLAQGPMNNDQPLHDALKATIAMINAAGGNATYLDLRGLVNDGCQSHPGRMGNRQMAQKAAPQIATLLGWGAMHGREPPPPSEKEKHHSSTTPAHASAHRPRPSILWG